VAGDRRMPWDLAEEPAESIMIARWPTPPPAWIDPRTEEQFGTFLGVVGAIREVRARQNVPPRTRVQAALRLPAATAELLLPMHAAIESMAMVELTAVGPEAAGAAGAATAAVPGGEVLLDLAATVDVAAEKVRLAKENEKLVGFIAAKRAKLADEKFAARAPEAVVLKERQQLAELEEKLAKGQATLAELEGLKK